MRGAVSLAAALALPLTLDNGTVFADRDLVIFLTVATILATLVVQGLTLPLLVRWLGVDGERPWSPDEAIARLAAAQAALDRLDEIESSEAARGLVSEDAVERLRELYRARFERCMAAISGEDGSTNSGQGPRGRPQARAAEADRGRACRSARLNVIPDSCEPTSSPGSSASSTSTKRG